MFFIILKNKIIIIGFLEEYFCRMQVKQESS